MDDRTTEERIALWLEAEAGGHLRDDVLTATFATTRSMGRRARPSGWRSIPMTRFLPAIAVGAAAVVVAAVLALNVQPGGAAFGVGGSAPSATPMPAPTPTPPIPSAATTAVDVTGWVPFASERYGYTISHPTDVASTPSSRAWTMDRDRADWQSPASDRFLDQARSILFTAFSAPIPVGMTTDGWITDYFSAATSASPDPCAAHPEDSAGVNADGHSAQLWAEPDNGACGATYAFVPVGDRMYAFVVWRPAQEPLLKAYLSTVLFTGSGTGAAAPSPLPRPSAVVDPAKAREVVNTFQDLMNAGRIDEAADLVWVGATISGRPTFSRSDVITALQTICGAKFAPDSTVQTNEVVMEGPLVDRPGYACPTAGQGYRARFTVENGLIVDYWPRAQHLNYGA